MSLICRTCLSESDNLVSIFKSIRMKNESFSLSSMIQELTNRFCCNDDKMPSTVCQECVYEICRCYFFRQQCLDSDDTLKSMLGINETIDEKIHIETIDHGNTISLEEVLKDEYSVQSGDDYYSDARNDNDDVEDESYNISENSNMKLETFLAEPNDDNIDEYNEEYIVEENNDDKPVMILQYEENDDPETKTIKTSIDFNEFTKSIGIEANNTNTDSIFLDLYNTNSDDGSNIDVGNLDFDCLIDYDCHICDKKCENVDTLISHILLIHEPNPEFRCTICNRLFLKQSTFKKHYSSHDPRLTNHCPYCGKKCKSFDDLKEHLEIHKKQDEEKFSCYFCGISYRLMNSCRIHMISKHKEQWEAYRKEIYNQQQEIESNNPLKHLCDVCGKECKSDYLLKSHLNRHKTDKPFKCDVCGKAFSLQIYLKDHIIRHTAEKTFKCDMCDKAFTRKRALKEHITRHNGDRPYECPMCDKKLASTISRDMHIRTHYGEKPYREWEARRNPRKRRPKKKPVEN